MIDLERYKRIDKLLQAALEMEPAERPVFLRENCGDDQNLTEEVEALIAGSERVDSLIDSPLPEFMTLFSPEQDLELSVGDTLSHYTVLSILGVGGAGQVYLAEDSRLGRKVALKLFPREFTKDQLRLWRFGNEARAASALNHPNILTIHDIAEIDGKHIITAEFVDGETLRHKIKQKNISAAEALDISIQVTNALSAAHKSGIIHRDIKPENIMLRRDGLVKVLDFGLAKLVEGNDIAGTIDASDPQMSDAEDNRSTAHKVVRTDTGLLMGTLPYMSPEQLTREQLDARTDLFSFGVVLYEMLSGELPFSGKTDSEVIAAILKADPTPMSDNELYKASKFQPLIEKALCKDRDKRYQTAADFLRDLEKLKETAGFGLNPPIRFWKSVRRHKILVISAILLLVAITSFVYRSRLFRAATQAPSLKQTAGRTLTRLTFNRGLQSEPAWSPDGRFIAYGSSDEQNTGDIWVQPASGGNAKRITTSAASNRQPDWSPDGTQIVFRSESEGGGLFVVPAEGGREQKISPFGYKPHWSPDGTKILFIDTGLGGETTFGAPKLYLMDLLARRTREVNSQIMSELHEVSVIGWHPDGLRISFQGGDRTGTWGFWTMQLDGGILVKSEFAPEVERLMGEEFDFPPLSCRWAPSGRSLYLQVVSKGIVNIWRVIIDPESLRWIDGPERLTTGAGLDTDLAVSPDGKSLAFTTRSENRSLWSWAFDARSGIVNGAGAPLTNSFAWALFPDLSPDGKRLSFVLRKKSDNWEMWERSLDDGRDTLLIADGYERWEPRWSRDGRRLAYRLRGKNNDGSIMVLDVSGTEQQITSQADSAQQGFIVAGDWSADGEWILVTMLDSSGQRTVLRLLPVRAAPHAETEAHTIASDPDRSIWSGRYSPDGRWITFPAVKENVGSVIYAMPADGGAWLPMSDDKYWADLPRWSPDGKTIYYLSMKAGFFNVWGRRFDPIAGKPSGESFQVTSIDNPSRMISGNAGELGMTLAANRLVLTMREVGGSVWVLENLEP